MKWLLILLELGLMLTTAGALLEGDLMEAGLYAVLLLGSYIVESWL